MLHVVTGHSNNTLSCSELNGEYAGESFKSIRHILTQLWACKAKKCHFSRKFDLWPDLTRSNVDQGLKTICAIARSHRDASTVFSAKLYDHQGPIARGVVPPPPPPLAKVAKYEKRARVKFAGVCNVHCSENVHFDRESPRNSKIFNSQFLSSRQKKSGDTPQP